MASKKDYSNLGYLGPKYQMRLVKCFIEDQSFFTKLSHIIDQNLFSEESLRRIVGLIKDRYAKTETVPTYNDIDVLIRSKISNEITVNELLETMENIKSIPFDGMDLIEDEAEKFFKQQNLTKALIKANDIIKKGNIGDYYAIEDIIKKALETNTKEELGYCVLGSIDNDLREDYRQTITTGCKELDDALYGGIGRGELGIIVAPLGVGKAQPLTSNILTPDGYKKMGDIKVGDKVVGRDGNSYNVTGVFPQGIRPIYKVSFSNGTSCECDEEHLWDVNTYWQRSRKTYVKGSGRKHPKKRFNPDNSFRTMSLKEIMEKGLTKATLGGFETKTFKIPNHECVNFNEQNITVNPYIIGYYIGDGCCQRTTITVGAQDYDSAIVNIGNLLKEDANFSYSQQRNIWTININKTTRKLLKEIFGDIKSEDKFIPKNYLFNSKEVRMELLQGLMDSDGYINKTGVMEYNTKSPQLSEDFYFLVRSLGAYAYKSVKNSGYKDKNGNYVDCGLSYRVRFSFHDETIIPFKLYRKLERVKYRTKYKNQIYITKIEYIGEKEAQCIMVNSDEHLYLTEDFIVTHNTSITTGISAAAAQYKTEVNNYQGFKVLHLFFEDDEVNINRKYFGNILDIDACNLSLPDYKANAIKQLKEDNEVNNLIKNNVRAMRLSSGEVTASQIKNIIKRHIAIGFKPDLVIVDYFECLKPERSDTIGDSEWAKEGVTMRKLESICKELKVALWVPIQGTKSSIGIDDVTLQHAGGSVKKSQIGHIIITVAQTEEQKERGTLNLYIKKFRAAKLGRIRFNDVKFNNGTGKFDMSEIDVVDRTLDGNKPASSNMMAIAKNVKREQSKNF